jgi:hypothetical protein
MNSIPIKLSLVPTIEPLVPTAVLAPTIEPLVPPGFEALSLPLKSKKNVQFADVDVPEDTADVDTADVDTADVNAADVDFPEDTSDVAKIPKVPKQNLKKINLSSLLNKIINDKISINDGSDDSIHLIFSDGFIQKINNGESKKKLLLSMRNGRPTIFFKEWEFTTFIHSSHQILLKEGRPFTVMESIYLYCPNNKFSHDLLCKKYKLNNRSNIILVVDLYEITQKNLFNTFGLEYLYNLSFDEIISKYHKLSKEIKTLFNDFYSIDCPNCGCITSINFMKIFPKTISFCKCAKCRHLILK